MYYSTSTQIWKTKYNLAECPTISCNQILSLAITESSAKADCVENSIGDMVQYLEGDVLKTYVCAEQDI